MPRLTVHSAAGLTHLDMRSEWSVREALDTTALRVRAACGGTGTCGACVVHLLEGQANPPTVAEYMKLSPEERAQGRRLACQLRFSGETATIRLDDPAPSSSWKSLFPDELPPVAGACPELSRYPYGLAVDLGTTHIRVALWDRKRGQRLATRQGPNPQGSFGADVLNRLAAACTRPEGAKELAQLARGAIIEAVRDMLARDVGEVSPMLREIGRVVVVGNTAMLVLLAERGGEELMAPENWQRRLDCTPTDPEAWRQSWRLPHAEFLVPAPTSGFVGSDLIADVLATGLAQGPPGSLLLDLGTNTELVLWDGTWLHLTSVAGGPAFEGLGLHFGMAAEPGAICRVRPDGAGFACTTIGGLEPRGFCGSGLADAIAVLRAQGWLKPSGRFAASPGPQGFRLLPQVPRSALFGSDVDAFQRAKAATAAAMDELRRQAGMRWGDLRRLCVCGAFGRHLDLAHAQSVGLLPPIDPARVELFANATLAGCERALLDPRGAELFDELRAETRSLNLSYLPDYDMRYIDHLRLTGIAP